MLLSQKLRLRWLWMLWELGILDSGDDAWPPAEVEQQ